MKKINLLLTFILIWANTEIPAQHLSAYTDYMDRFYVFDRGNYKKIEDLAPQSFKVGGECVMYVSSNGHLKMYSNGKVTDLERTGVSYYSATDYLATYNIYEKLKVVYNGKVVLLSNRCTNYLAADSMVVFYDKNTELLRIFYKGKVSDIESGMIDKPAKMIDGGDNIIAYITGRTNDFKIWYKGEVHVINRNVGNTDFKAGRDIVAFVDEVEQNLKAFYQGKVYVLDDFVPESFQVGDGFVAFVNQAGEFKIFTGGTVHLISPFSPQSYLTEDNILAFVEDNYFKVWYNGEVIEIEPFVPSTYKLDWNTVAYLDRSNRIWIYQKGKKSYLLNDFVIGFEIYRDLIQMSVKVNRNIIYYQNRFYEGLSDFK